MSFEDLYSRFNDWSRQIPYTTKPNIHDTDIDTNLVLTKESIKEQEAKFKEFIAKENHRKLAVELAAAVDDKRIQISDLDENGLPKNLLSHKGARDGGHNQGDEVLNSILKFFETLISWGYKNQEEKELQTDLKRFALTVYDFLEQVYRESKSLESYLNVKNRVQDLAFNITKSINKQDTEESSDIESAVRNYLSFIDTGYIGDEFYDKSSLARYARSLNSYSNEVLLTQSGPVNHKYLNLIKDEFDQEILKALESEAKMSLLKEKFKLHAKYIDCRLKELPVESPQYQYSLIWFIALREFFAGSNEDYSKWAQFRDGMHLLSS